MEAWPVDGRCHTLPGSCGVHDPPGESFLDTAGGMLHKEQGAGFIFLVFLRALPADVKRPEKLGDRGFETGETIVGRNHGWCPPLTTLSAPTDLDVIILTPDYARLKSRRDEAKEGQPHQLPDKDAHWEKEEGCID